VGDRSTVAGNPVTPCGFENDAELAAWTLAEGVSASYVAGAGENGTGAARVDAEEVQPNNFSAVLRSPCLPIAPNLNVEAGFVARTASGGNLVNCFLNTRQYSDAGCGNVTSVSGSMFSVVIDGSYSAIAHAFQTQDDAVAFTMSLLCFDPVGVDIVVDFDNAFAVGSPVSAVAAPTLGRFGLAIGGLLLVALAFWRLHRFAR